MGFRMDNLNITILFLLLLLHSVVPSGDTNLNEFFAEYWENFLQKHPETATVVGDHRFDDQLDCLSLLCFQDEKDFLGYLTRAKDFQTYEEPESENDLNLQLFVSNLQFKILNLESNAHLFPVSKLWSSESSLRHLLKYVVLNDSAAYRNISARYRAFPKQLEEIQELMEMGARTGFTLNEHSLPSKKERDFSVCTSPFIKPFLNISLPMNKYVRNSVMEDAFAATLGSLIPALHKFDDFMEEYRKYARPEIGASSLPNGSSFYRAQLSYHLTDPAISPGDVHQMGVREVQRIAQEMDEVIRSLGFNMTRDEFKISLQQNVTQKFQSAEEAINTYRDTLENVITPKLTQLFKKIPDKALTVEKVPDDQAGEGPGAYYTSPSGDGATPGTFYLDTSSLKDIPRYEVVTLAMHEGLPGHHFQHAYVFEQTDIPAFRKYDMHSTAFIEGWALYAEYLGYELGLYEDPYMRYGHLSYEMLRAVRMVVDTGIHAFNWSYEEAIEYMLSFTPLTRDAVIREVDRYITWPGQACAYKYGEMKIKDLRRLAETALGDAFDVKEFHDVILRTNGPLEIVARQVERWINRSKQKVTTPKNIATTTLNPENIENTAA